jgi:hypothetical protein
MTTTAAHTTRQRTTALARNGRPGSVAAQVKDQRRGYARAVVRSLARAQRGQPVAQVQRVLRGALTPLGVRLSPAALRELAAGIAAGTPVELP